MSEQQQPAEPAAQPEPTPAPVAAAKPAETTQDPPPWLPDRLKQARESERKKLLQELGAETPDDLKAKLAKLSELETSQLTEQERTQKLIQELTPKAEQAERLSGLFSSVVESRFSQLSEAQQTAIDAVANGSAEERWKLMSVLDAAIGAAPPPAPKPAQTAPQGASPPPSPATPKTARDKWIELQRSDPMQASLFYQANAFEIQKG